MPAAPASLIAELESSVKDDSPEDRIRTLRRITDLFLGDADRLNDEQVDVFDDVLGLLIRGIESRALVEISKRLAPVDNAPLEVTRRLARDEEIEVAGPVLTHSRRLPTSDLIEIAASKGQAHMLAISERPQLEESVTDVLLYRGNDEVTLKLATNPGARFSETGFGILVKDAEANDRLAETVGLRFDLPPRFLRELLQRATDTVRSRIVSQADPQARDEIQRMIVDAAKAVGRKAAEPRDFTSADLLIQSMEKCGKLNERALLEFANQRKYEEMTIALARLSSTPLKLMTELMEVVRNDGLLVSCKAANLTWETTRAIMCNRHSRHKIPDQIIELAWRDFNNLSVATAQRTLRFMQVRTAAK
jgi:uncharacterized protein (DUF2336 family)